MICAPWTKARDFEHEKSLSGDFRLVRALNVDSLEAWLECAPLTTVWLREQIGEPGTWSRLAVDLVGEVAGFDNDAVGLAGWVLAGRDKQAETLRDRCQQRRGGVITIGGDVHRDEILAFVAAALVASDASGSFPADALHMEDRAATQRLLAAEALIEFRSSEPARAVHDGGGSIGGISPAVCLPGASTVSLCLFLAVRKPT